MQRIERQPAKACAGGLEEIAAGDYRGRDLARQLDQHETGAVQNLYSITRTQRNVKP